MRTNAQSESERDNVSFYAPLLSDSSDATPNSESTKSDFFYLTKFLLRESKLTKFMKNKIEDTPIIGQKNLPKNQNSSKKLSKNQ